MTSIDKVAFALALMLAAGLRAADNDGDGLLDSWEVTYGLSTTSVDTASSGLGDYWDDPDHDGLANHTELIASTTSPTNAYSVSALTNDYFLPSGMGSYVGADLTDNDHLDDRWEARHTPAASLAAWDEATDYDGDGWDNWSERQAGTSPLNAAAYPSATINLTVRYSGFQSLGAKTLVLHLDTDRAMQGVPDAVMSAVLPVGVQFPSTLTLTSSNLLSGHIRQGANFVWAWVQNDASSNAGMGPTWTTGEAAGIADTHQFGALIGAGVNPIAVGLSDIASSYARLDFSGLTSGTAKNVLKNDAIVRMTAYIDAPRTWLSEVDEIAQKTNQFGYGWGNVYAPQSVSDWWLNDVLKASAVLTNFYAGAGLALPVVTYPTSGVVRSAQTTLRFTVMPEATSFSLGLNANGVSFGSWSQRLLTELFYGGLAGVSNMCKVAYDLPFSWGDCLPAGLTTTNGQYYWTIMQYSPADTGGSSVATTGKFALNISTNVADHGGLGWIVCSVAYPWQSALAGKHVRVEAYDNPGWSGYPACSRDLNAATGTVVLAGLVPGAYYVRAFVDDDADRAYDAGTEPYSYVRTDRDAHNPFQPRACYARTRDTGAVTISILDP